jgi:hypothetical protein
MSRSEIRLFTGVPWDNSYTHVRWFRDDDERQNFLNTLLITSDVRFNIVRGKSGVFKVKERWRDVRQASYLMFRMNEDSKWFYAFIDDIFYVNDRVSLVSYTIDVMQTWLFDFTIRDSFIDREHQALENTRNYINEGLDLGDQYITVASHNFLPQDVHWLVLCCKERMDDRANGIDFTDNQTMNHPDGLVYYVFPFDPDLPSRDVSGLVGLTGVSSTNTIAVLIQSMQIWNQLGEVSVNNVVNMYITDVLPVTSRDLIQVNMVNSTDGVFPLIVQGWLVKPDRATPSPVNNTTDVTTITLSSVVGTDIEKLRYSPYTIIELTDGRGNIIQYHPEGVADDMLTFRCFGSIGATQATTISLVGYNNLAVGITQQMLMFHHALNNINANDLAIENNYMAAFMQGNKNQINQNRVEWSTQYAYDSRINSFQNAQHSLNIAKGGIEILHGFGNANTATKSGNISGGEMDGVSGALAGGMQMAHGILDVASASIDLAAGIRTGQRIGELYDQKHAMLAAQKRDFQNIPPSLSNQGSNINIWHGNRLYGYTVAIKRPREIYLQIARDYLHKYGYKALRVGVPNMTTRTHFNFVKLGTCNLVASFPQEDIANIRAIFEKGVTLWHTNDMLNYNVTNGEVTP